MDPVIDVRGLVKRYGPTTAVDDVSFEVREGEIFGLLGPNGAGKTTAVEIVQGLRVPDAGAVRVLGIDPQTEPGRLRPLIGSQLQESALPARMRVWEALDLFGSLLPGGPDWREVLDRWGLGPKANASFVSLSGGQRQRLLVALALINEPRVVFLDEMTTGLDPAARRATWHLIERVRDAGTTVVLVTHFMDEAERLCNRLAVFDRGRIVATGSPAELVSDHQLDLTVTFTTDRADVDFLRSVAGVSAVERRGRLVEISGRPCAPPYVGQALVEHGLVPDDLAIVRPSLEDVYLAIVGEEQA